MSRIQTPVQLIQASEDDMTSVRNSQFIHDHVGSAQKEIVLLHDSYHVITADQERRIVARKMDEFFCRIRGVEPGGMLNGEEEDA
jgi:carboxylesterase